MKTEEFLLQLVEPNGQLVLVPQVSAQEAAGPTGGGKTDPSPVKPHATGRTNTIALSPRALAFTNPLVLPAGILLLSWEAVFSFASSKVLQGQQSRCWGLSPYFTALAESLPLAAPWPSTREHITQAQNWLESRGFNHQGMEIYCSEARSRRHARDQRQPFFKKTNATQRK